jgi:hypothetical protein
VGYLYDYGDSGFFNRLDVFHQEAEFPSRVRDNKLSVWLFNFCPMCGRPVDRQSVADRLGLSLDACGEARE